LKKKKRAPFEEEEESFRSKKEKEKNIHEAFKAILSKNYIL
jgi:hypothetical protein